MADLTTLESGDVVDPNPETDTQVMADLREVLRSFATARDEDELGSYAYVTELETLAIREIERIIAAWLDEVVFS